jgi:predicted pyridoxine 5'-phosphate oxidase superfamily flavin-nucleotide-binding protein
MTAPRVYSSDVAFSPSVKVVQERKGSRRAYARMEEGGSWETRITPELSAFIASQRSVFLATASLDGQPYVQHRGGPPGFLRMLDERTLAFADFVGNRQYITLGNLEENPKAQLFLIDYATRRRIKIWGEARVVSGDAALLAAMTPERYRARIDQVLVFSVAAWDSNCPQHIPRRFEEEDVKTLLAERDARIASLEDELASLKAARPCGALP